MSGNFKKEDLRIKKTYKALINAMYEMLSHCNFNHITVNDLCEEALISRATFYVHFNDKYDLLKYWLSDIKEEIIEDIHEYEKTEITVNQFIQKNQKMITNILKEANSETIELVEDCISSIIEVTIKSSVNDKKDPRHVILLNFCTGGLVNLLLLQVEERFKSEFNMINEYLYKMLKHIMEWDSKQEEMQGGK